MAYAVRYGAVVAILALTALASSDAASQPIPRFSVDVAYDAVDAAPGDGVCADASGECTLRAAVMESNAHPGYDTIVAGGTFVLTIPGTGEDEALTGDLDITDNVLITGGGIAGTIVDGGGLDRVFDIHPSGGGGFETLAIRNGSTLAMAGTADDKGGGILNRGAAMLLIAAVSDSKAGMGGGIYSEGQLGLMSVEIKNNQAVAPGSGVGGGVFSAGPLTAQGYEFRNNSATAGGSAIHAAGDLQLEYMSVVGNAGGAAAVYSGGQMSARWSVINGGSSGAGGILSGGSVNLENVTISGNDGSGLAVQSGGTSSLTNVTIADNRQTGISGIGTTNLKNTIVANNTGANCTAGVVSLGHNIDSAQTCSLGKPGDLSNTDPKLGPLTESFARANTFRTFTHPLLNASAAIDSGENAGCPVEDQRLFPRPNDGDGDGIAVCDIGAYEADGVPLAGSPTPLPPNSLPSTGGYPGSASGLPVAAVITIPIALLACVGYLFRRGRP